MTSRRVILFASFCSAIFSSDRVLAATDVNVSPEQVEAARLIWSPDATSLRLEDRKGYFQPGSSFQYMGVAPATFDIDLGTGGDLANVHFNNLQIRGVKIGFEKGRLRVEIGIVDQEKAIKTLIGAISFKGVSVVLWVKPSSDSRGGVILAQDGCEVRGEMKGSGLIGAGTVKKIKDQLVDNVKKQVDHAFADSKVRDRIEEGIIQYARFAKDVKLERYVPYSLSIAETGISYQAE